MPSNNKKFLDVRKKMGRDKDLLTTTGSILVALGVAVWGVYALLRWGLGWDVTERQFLPYHLAGVIPGMILRRRSFLLRIVSRVIPGRD